MKKKIIIRNALLIGIALCYGSIYAGSGQGIPAFTKPCFDVTLSFVQPGSIAAINYKEGDTVQIGDILIKQDDGVEQIKLEQLKAESDNTTPIEHADITLKQRDVDLKRLKQAGAAVTTPTEVEYADLNVQIAQLQLYIAKFQHEQAKKKYAEAQKQIDRMSLKSPIDGRIETIEKQVGESVNALDKVIRIVRIDPLWIDVAVPMAQTANLRNGGKAAVEFPEPRKMKEEGTIIFISSVGNAGSDTLTVRVQVPNKFNRPARENVSVTFPAGN
ncbi:MAG: efflux RND transporter periplasmic adaptor subunit [Sedimentisphaerales bacterium]|nr:efflux RND transporter periplasmic adaptor subunit [Sedimentisphaerales bacterium]